MEKEKYILPEDESCKTVAEDLLSFSAPSNSDKTVEYDEEKEAFLLTAKINAAKMFAKYL